MRYQSSTLRPATIQILDGVLYSSSDEVAAELIPVLARKCSPQPSLMGKLIARQVAWPAAVEFAHRMDRDGAISVLDTHRRLPAEVLEVFFEKHGRSQYIADQFARRSDLTVKIARKLAGRRHRTLRYTISQNATFPVPGVWSHLDVVRADDRYGRYSVQAAWGLCEDLLDKALNNDGNSERQQRRDVDTAVRVMPGTRPAMAVSQKLLLTAQQGLLSASSLSDWVRRGIDSSGISWWLEILEETRETSAGGRDLFSHDTVKALCEYYYPSRSYLWRDSGTAVQAARSPLSPIRATAWAHPLNAAAVAELCTDLDVSGVSQVELVGMAQNPAIDAATARRLLTALGEDAWLLHRSAALDHEDRLSLLQGPGARSIVTALADAMTSPVEQPWTRLWWSPELFAAAIKAAGTSNNGSVLLEIAVTSWPEKLESFVENVRIGHTVGTMVAAAVVSRLASMDGGTAKVVSGLIDEWDEPLAALVRAAKTL